MLNVGLDEGECHRAESTRARVYHAEEMSIRDCHDSGRPVRGYRGGSKAQRKNMVLNRALEYVSALSTETKWFLHSANMPALIIRELSVSMQKDRLMLNMAIQSRDPHASTTKEQRPFGRTTKLDENMTRKVYFAENSSLSTAFLEHEINDEARMMHAFYPAG